MIMRWSQTFFHISHTYSAIVHKFTGIYPVCSSYELTKQFIKICVKLAQLISKRITCMILELDQGKLIDLWLSNVWQTDDFLMTVWRQMDVKWLNVAQTYILYKSILWSNKMQCRNSQFVLRKNWLESHLLF